MSQSPIGLEAKEIHALKTRFQYEKIQQHQKPGLKEKEHFLPSDSGPGQLSRLGGGKKSEFEGREGPKCFVGTKSSTRISGLFSHRRSSGISGRVKGKQKERPVTILGEVSQFVSRE